MTDRFGILTGNLWQGCFRHLEIKRCKPSLSSVGARGNRLETQAVRAPDAVDHALIRRLRVVPRISK